MADPRFVCIVGPSFGESFQIPQKKATIGSGSDSFIRIKDASIEPKHLEISYDGTTLTVQDLSSAKDLKINSKSSQSGAIRHGDKVTLGQIVLRVEWPSHDSPVVEKPEWIPPVEPTKKTAALWSKIGFAALILVCAVVLVYALTKYTQERKGYSNDAVAPTKPLQQAVVMGDLRTVMAHVHAGTNINRANDQGFTPLHFAALNNQIEIAKVLLEHGADTSAETNDGATPADLATSQHNDELAKIIREWSKKKAP